MFWSVNIFLKSYKFYISIWLLNMSLDFGSCTTVPDSWDLDPHLMHNFCEQSRIARGLSANERPPIRPSTNKAWTCPRCFWDHVSWLVLHHYATSGKSANGNCFLSDAQITLYKFGGKPIVFFGGWMDWEGGICLKPSPWRCCIAASGIVLLFWFKRLSGDMCTQCSTVLYYQCVSGRALL